MKPWQLFMVITVALVSAHGLIIDDDMVTAGTGTFWNYAGVVSVAIMGVWVLFGYFGDKKS